MYRHSAPVVLKLGGSLLDVPDLDRRLNDVLHRYAPSPLLLLVGGGRAADLVRDWDRRHELGDDTAHRLALDAMSLNSRLVAALIPQSELVRRPEACEAVWNSNRLPIIDPATFIPALEASAGEVPHTWDVTSDSLSAWIAERVSADRLVLLKSLDCPDRGIEMGSGLVDREFPSLIGGLRRIEWINLRSAVADPRPFRLPTCEKPRSGA